jgi:hypothetical protein
MNEVEQLKTAIEKQHGGKATFKHSIPVSLEFKGEKTWEGIVNEFTLSDHPTATKAYAWAAAIEGSKKRRYYAVVGIPPINSAQDAVRAAIVQEYKTAQK